MVENVVVVMKCVHGWKNMIYCTIFAYSLHNVFFLLLFCKTAVMFSIFSIVLVVTIAIMEIKYKKKHIT